MASVCPPDLALHLRKAFNLLWPGGDSTPTGGVRRAADSALSALGRVPPLAGSTSTSRHLLRPALSSICTREPSFTMIWSTATNYVVVKRRSGNAALTTSSSLHLSASVPGAGVRRGGGPGRRAETSNRQRSRAPLPAPRASRF
jgi:hypothetical protein